ncbi:MAG: hypothetical protein MUE32_03410 [Bacteroidales bacterium]|nr:hypothetical protein [Bacteroidales bacterium]
MELFRNVRLRFGRASLDRRLAKTKRAARYTDLDRVRTMGIVWDAAATKEFPDLQAFHHKMHERGIEVTILGYYDGKELPDQYTAIRYLTCLRRNELNNFYIPVSREAEMFINREFDILIDLNFRNQFSLYCISALSRAAFKVGLMGTDSVSDLMMDIKNPQEIGSYLGHVIHYLEMINSG